MTLHRDVVEAFMSELAEAQELANGGRFVDAREKLVKLQRSLEREGTPSAHVFARLAETWRASGSLEDQERAFELSCRALVLDPIHPWYSDQFAALAAELRRRLAVDFASANAPRLYATLQRVGETDASSHVCMARHHAEAGETAQAVALLQAAVLLDPTLTDGWLLWAELCDAAGRAEEAASHRARAASLERSATTFSMPAAPTAC